MDVRIKYLLNSVKYKMRIGKEIWTLSRRIRRPPELILNSSKVFQSGEVKGWEEKNELNGVLFWVWNLYFCKCLSLGTEDTIQTMVKIDRLPYVAHSMTLEDYSDRQTIFRH